VKRKRRKQIAFINRVAEYRKRDLAFFMENAQIPCHKCQVITTIHAYGKGKEVIRYACWNKKCPFYGVEMTMTNCHMEIKKYLKEV